MTKSANGGVYRSMIRRLVLTLVVVASLSVSAAPASASCVAMTVAQQRARADLIFDGIALDGPTYTGIERFRVLRYLKGSGPRIVRISTGRRRHVDGRGVVTSVSINAGKGETGRIYARSFKPGILQTNVCDGSRRLRRAR